MPRTYKILLHKERVLWPEYFPLADVLTLKANTDDYTWSAGYQCSPKSETGAIFLREWWSDVDARYDITDHALLNICIGRFLMFDTAQKTKQSSDYSAMTVFELLPDYRVVIRRVWKDKILSADLPDVIAAFAVEYNYDNKLKAIVIEDKSSGTNAVQYLQLNSEPWLRKLIVPFMPVGDKEERARRITPFCKKKRVLLPFASEHAAWLLMCTEELFDFPASAHDDVVDTITMGCDFLSNYLADGMLNAGVSTDDD